MKECPVKKQARMPLHEYFLDFRNLSSWFQMRYNKKDFDIVVEWNDYFGHISFFVSSDNSNIKSPRTLAKISEEKQWREKL